MTWYRASLDVKCAELEIPGHMPPTSRSVCLSALLLVTAPLAAQERALPAWAYVLAPAPDVPDDGAPRRVPGSAVALTLTQTRDRFQIPDWHPDGHPAMPPAVALGRRPGAFACGFCHLPNGQGRPENASLAGLTAEYIARQVADFRDGRRRSAEPRHAPGAAMIAVARNADSAAVREAALYFAGLTPRRWVRVVETDSVPATRGAGFMLVPVPGAAREGIAGRIVEVPEDLERTELRDDASGFVAYVPKGSVRRGEALVAGRTARTQACARCHGASLRGAGDVPRLAGRSPSYLVRQLYDFQTNARAGAFATTMFPIVVRLTDADIVAIAAYLASREP